MFIHQDFNKKSKKVFLDKAYILKDFNNPLLPDNRLYVIGRLDNKTYKGKYSWYLFDFSTGIRLVSNPLGITHGTRGECLERDLKYLARISKNEEYDTKLYSSLSEAITEKAKKIPVINTLYLK